MLPEGWKTYNLSDLIILIGGGTPKTDVAEYWNGSIPWLSVVDFNSGNKHVYRSEKLITEKGLQESATKILKKGQIIISARGTVGEMALLGRDMAFNQSCYGIVANNKAHNDFLFYLLKSSIQRIKKKTHGAVFDTITKQTFDNISVTIPDNLSEQSRIASILSSLDDKIELNLQMNKTLEAIAQAIFKEWFRRIKNSPLSEYVDFNPKIALTKGSVVKYVEMSDLPQTGFSVMSYIDRPFTSGSKFQNFDTLLARITPCLENGKAGFVDFLKPGETAFGSTEFIVMRPKKGVSPYFVYLISRNTSFREYAIKSMVGTSGRQRVQTDMLHTYQIPVVDPIQMQSFNLLIKPLFERIKSNSDNNTTLSLIRDILLPKLMTGKIRVA